MVISKLLSANPNNSCWDRVAAAFASEEKRALQLTADDIFLSLSRIEEVKFKAKKEQPAEV